MGYQWDYLLLETGFLAIFLISSLPRIWLFQWLLFRLMFESGIVKLTSHDATWSNLTALTHHYQTQPLPTPLAWYMNQLPLWFQKSSTVFVFTIELVLPFLVLAPRRFKQAAAIGMISLQTLILLTGNYTFFNWLSIALCIFLLDDRFFNKPSPMPIPSANRYVSIALVVFVAVIGCSQLLEIFSIAPPAPVRFIARQIAPFGLVNQYGLFASMTTTRPEISIERLQRRHQLAALPIPLQSRPTQPCTILGRSLPTAARLADVVRLARQLPRKPLVHAATPETPARIQARVSAIRTKPVPQPITEIHPRDGLRIPLHGLPRAPQNRQLVDPRTERHLLSGSLLEVIQASPRNG